LSTGAERPARKHEFFAGFAALRVVGGTCPARVCFYLNSVCVPIGARPPIQLLTLWLCAHGVASQLRATLPWRVRLPGRHLMLAAESIQTLPS
jgi:hypothetical protein